MNLKTIVLIGGPFHIAQNLRHILPIGFSLDALPGFEANALKQANAVLLFKDELEFDGLSLIQPVRQAAPNVPVIIFGTSSLPPADVAEAFRLGAHDFLFLPFDSDTLRSCLFRFIPAENPEPQLKWWSRLYHNWVAKPNTHSSQSVCLGISPYGTGTGPGTLPPRADVQVQLLGPLRLTILGQKVNRLPSKKARSLLAYMLRQYPRRIHREVLLDKFWPHSRSDSARNCLNVTLHAIRKCLDGHCPSGQFIVYENEGYRLAPGLKLERDIDHFEMYWNKAKRLEIENGMAAAVNTYHQAFAFYRGDLLEDLPFEEWIENDRERWRETWLVILDRLSKHFFEKGKYQISLSMCKKMLDKDDCLEDVHRRLMACYHRLDMKDLAVKQYRRCRVALQSGLSVVPGRATLDLFKKIQAA